MNKKLPYIFAFFPILNIYETGIIPALSIGQILLFLYFCGYLKHNKLTLQFPIYIVYSILISFISLFKPGISTSESVHELFALMIFFILYSFVIKSVNYSLFLHGVKALGFISLFFFYFQFILSLVGIHIIGIIPGIPLSNGSDSAAFQRSHLLLDRLSSIFQEPAHFAEFMSMFLTILLYKLEDSRKKYVIVLAISISIILSRSAGGYVLFLVGWIGWGVFRTKGKKNKLKYILTPMILVLVALPIALNNSMIGSVLNRFQTLSLTPENSEYGYSSYIRLFRGYIPFIESSWIEMCFGHGVGTLLSFVRTHPNSMFLAITEYDANWINSVQFILFSTGIVGAFLFFRYLAHMYKKTSPLGKTLTWIYILALCSSGMLLTASSMLFLYIIYVEQRKSQNCINLSLAS